MHFKNHQEYLQFFRQPPVEPKEYIPAQETPKTAENEQEEASAKEPEPEKPRKRRRRDGQVLQAD